MVCVESILLLRSLTVAAHELIDASGRVDELALTGVEGVRGAGDFYFYHWVSLAFELYGVISLCSRLRKEHIAVGHVLEHDGAIVFWMNSFFHCYLNVDKNVSACKGTTFFPIVQTFHPIFLFSTGVALLRRCLTLPTTSFFT